MLRNIYINTTIIYKLRMMNNQLSLVPPPNLHEEVADIESLSQSLDKSLRNLSGKKVFFRSDFSRESVPLQSMESTGRPIPFEIRNFSEKPSERLLVGIDSSCALIGETEDGSLFAGRVAMVSTSKDGKKSHYRAGPFIFYMNQEILGEELSKLPRKAIRGLLSDTCFAERFVRIRLERSAQLQAAKLNTNSIILADGAIRSSVLESRKYSLRELELAAARNSNQIIGFSKTSSLRFVSSAASFLQSIGRGKVYFDITDSVRVFMPCTGSRILVSRFSPNSHVFRVDTSLANTDEDSQVLADLSYNDLFFRGYPETLRLAHHLSVFDAFTISSIRSYLSKEFKLIRIASDDLRATILGKLV